MGALVLGALLGGCGTQGGEASLPDAWPRTPLRGFALRDPDQPYALLRLGWDLDQPAVAPRPDDPAVPLTIWGRMNPRQEPLLGTLFRAAVSDLGAAQPPELALAPSAPWEGTDLGSPAFLAGEAGMPSLLFYQGADGSIGLCRLNDDGSVQRLTTAQPLVTASALAVGRLGRVSALRTGSRVRLYYLVDGQHVHFAEADAAALLRRAAGGQEAVDFQVSAPLLWAAEFSVRQTTVTTVPAERLEGAYVRRVTTALGRDRFDLYAVATAMGKSVVVSASSYSGGRLGDSSERFLAVESPALSGSDQGTPSNPTVVQYGGQALLVVGLRTVQTGIATARQSQ
jgi:hypothetical protein